MKTMSLSIVIRAGLKPVIRLITELQKTRIDYTGERQCQDKEDAAQLRISVAYIEYPDEGRKPSPQCTRKTLREIPEFTLH